MSKSTYSATSCFSRTPTQGTGAMGKRRRARGKRAKTQAHEQQPHRLYPHCLPTERPELLNRPGAFRQEEARCLAETGLGIPSASPGYEFPRISLLGSSGNRGTWATAYTHLGVDVMR